MGAVVRVATAALVCAAAVFVAYAFGGGWLSDRGVGLPAPLNVAGSLAVLWAAGHAAYVLVVPERRAAPRAARAVTIAGAIVAAATVAAVIVSR